MRIPWLRVIGATFAVVFAAVIPTENVMAETNSPVSGKLAGVVTDMEGRAQAANSNGVNRDLATDDKVFEGDTLTTKEKSKLLLTLTDGSEISVGENSTMTLDEYIYEPDNKSSVRAVIALGAGVFRVLSGKITKINPERFNVLTRLATIGIRGCEIGVRLDAAREACERIYVLMLTKNERILVNTRENGQTRQLDLTKGGNMVSIQPDESAKPTQSRDAQQQQQASPPLLPNRAEPADEQTLHYERPHDHYHKGPHGHNHEAPRHHHRASEMETQIPQSVSSTSEMTQNDWIDLIWDTTIGIDTWGSGAEQSGTGEETRKVVFQYLDSVYPGIAGFGLFSAEAELPSPVIEWQGALYWYQPNEGFVVSVSSRWNSDEGLLYKEPPPGGSPPPPPSPPSPPSPSSPPHPHWLPEPPHSESGL